MSIRYAVCVAKTFYQTVGVLSIPRGPPLAALAVSNSIMLALVYYELCQHIFNFNRLEFMAHYHKRSNIESAFSMIKAKFGGSVRSKSPVAQVNEVLLKVLCHNICVLLQSIGELGIEANFWDCRAELAPARQLALFS